MKRVFLGLSDCGMRIYDVYEPGEVDGDLGIIMTIGTDPEGRMHVLDSRQWGEKADMEAERRIELNSHHIREMYANSFLNRGTGKSFLSQIPRFDIDFRSLEKRIKDKYAGSYIFFYDFDPATIAVESKCKAYSKDSQHHHKRKPQPNRGPLRHKDWL